MNVGNVKFKAWDLGGHKQVRGAWKDYFAEADAIIFVVDAADQERMGEAQEVTIIVDPATLFNQLLGIKRSAF